MSQKLTKSIDLLELLKDGRHHARTENGVVQILDSVTGNIVAMFTDPNNPPTNLVESALPSGNTVWIQEGMNPLAGGRREIVYSPLVIDLLCQAIAEGGSLTELCRNDRRFPLYSTLRRWARSHPWIDEALAQARRDRAEYLRDQALAEAQQAEGKDPISGSQLRVDTYKWAAGVDDGKYSPKAKVEATINQPTQIVVMTGIDRTPLPAAIDVTPKEGE